MAQIIWTEPALNDLNEIAEYIALDKAHAAETLVRSVFRTVQRLKDFPESGKKPEELPETESRGVIAGPCRIFYRVHQESVCILYIMRGEKELRRFILSDRNDEIS